MSNEGAYRYVVENAIRIENAVRNGGEGLCELRECWQGAEENDLREVVTAERIVGALSADVRDWLLIGFIENFCE